MVKYLYKVGDLFMGQKQMVKLSTKDMKKIVHEVVEKEKRANHLEIDAFPVTLIE